MKLYKFIQQLREKFFAAEIYADPEMRRQAQLTSRVLRLLVVFSLLFLLLALIVSAWRAILFVGTLLVSINLISMFLLRSGKLRFAQTLPVVGLLAVFTLGALFGQSIVNTPFAAMILAVIIAGLILGNLSGLLTAAVASFIGVGLVALELSGRLPTAIMKPEPYRYWFSMTLIFFACAALIILVMNSLKQAIGEAEMYAQAQAESLAELEQVRASLEEQVLERTRELERRTRYLQGILDVTQATTTLLDSDQVISAAVELIKEQFHLYYVGMFLTDASGEWAVLKAGTGAAGKAMLERGHRIRVGSGMIGWSIANSQPRVAGAAEQDVVRLVTAELPDTRSEAAIPLRSRGRVIGALSVQSERINAFGEMEIASFQALADQVAVSQDNARLYSESRKALEESRRAYGEMSRRSWQDFLQGMDQIELTYRYGINETAQAGREARIESGQQALVPTQDGPVQCARQEALQSNRPVQICVGKNALLFLPIPVREVQIGVISFSRELPASSSRWSKAAGWTQEETELLQSIVEQLGVALDSARLYQDTQRLAYREQVTGEVTARIRQTLDIQTVLRTAVEEIQRTLGLPEVVISLAPAEEERSRVEVED